MVLNENMSEVLTHIIQVQPEIAELMRDEHCEEEELCSQLVRRYRETEDLETRKLIMEFMQDAGYTWLRRLFTRDTDGLDVAA
jgi:hypothetical protein